MQLIRYLIVFAGLGLFFGAPAADALAAAGISGFSPSDGATVQDAPTLSVVTFGFDPASTLTIRFSAGDAVFADGVTLEATAGGNAPSVFSADPPSPLEPGTYYWQWEYHDRGCEWDGPGPFDCGAGAGTQCDVTGRCTGPVLSFMVENPPAPAPVAPSPVVPPQTTVPAAQTTPPANMSPPTRTGAARVGSRLAVAPGNWVGADLSFTFQWNRCDRHGESCRAIRPHRDRYRDEPGWGGRGDF
jgi:hypothetical protein